MPITRLRILRSAALTLAGVVLATSAAGCGSSDSSAPGSKQAADEPVTLTMTIWGGDTDKKVYGDRLALAKKELPNITVKLVQISDDYDAKTQTMIAGGKAPDVMMVAEGVNVLSSKGQLLDLAGPLKDADVDPVSTFGQGAVDTYSTDGKLWAAPDRSGAMVLYYNKDIFDAAGVGYPDGAWTWEQFRGAAKQLTQRDGSKVKTWGYAAGDWWPWYMTWIYQNGGRVLDDRGQPVVNSTENVEALSFYNDMVFTDKSAPSPVDYANAGLKNGQPDPLFAQGKLAMEATGFWNIATLNQTDLNWGVAPLWHGKESAIPAFGSGLAVTTQSKHQAQAIQLVSFLTSAAGQKPIATSGLDVPANNEVAKSPDFTDPSWNTKGVDLSAFSQSATSIYSPPLVPEWNEIQKAFTDGLDATWKGEASVADGLAKVQKTLEGVLG